MKLIQDFNQSQYLASVPLDGLNNNAVQNGSCTVISSFFLRLVSVVTTDLGQINTEFAANKATIAQTQTRAAELWAKDQTGYDYVLQQCGLRWAGNDYIDRTQMQAGQCALLLITLPGGAAHTMAVVHHPSDGSIYLFDPNYGVFEFSRQEWMGKLWPPQLMAYNPINATFRNVVHF